MGSMGLTSFMQEITRLRALEGEIARTIQAMKGVKAARVHIVLPDHGSFRRNAPAAVASVIIRTECGRRVSSAAGDPAPGGRGGAGHDRRPGDGAEHGRHHAGGGRRCASTPRRPRWSRLEKTIGKELQDNISKRWRPISGLDNFEISVAVRLNTDKRQTNETNFNPEGKAERSVRVVKETGSSQNSNAKGRPWASSRTCPPSRRRPGPGGDQNRKQNERREELTNYEVSSKTISDGQRGLQDREPGHCGGRQPQAPARRARRGCQPGSAWTSS